jgi:hypothetical protein
MFNITRAVFECLHRGPVKMVMPVNPLWSHIGHILQNVVIIMARYISL